MHESRVLVADDDRYTLTHIRKLLESWEYEVVVAENGVEALGVLESKDAPVVAILDWIMPEMSGTEVCSTYRSHYPDASTYLMLLTIRDRPQQLIEGLEAGADDYLIKPFDEGVLRARIEVGFRLHQAQLRAARSARLRSALEMAGAVCHELNQPLQVVMGNSELLAYSLKEQSPEYESVEEIRRASERLGELTRKLMRIARYETKQYIGDRSSIVDLDRSSESEPEG